MPLVQLIKVNGLPAHPLVVHAAVVFIPLAAIGAIAYAVPRFRDYLRWPLVVVALVAVASVWAAFYTGGNFRDSSMYFHQGELGKQLDKHEDYANVLAWVVSGLAVAVVVFAGVWHKGSTTVRGAAAAVLVVVSIVALVYVFLTGEAGAKAVYPSSSPVVSVSTR